jgi:hypothetical protein
LIFIHPPPKHNILSTDAPEFYEKPKIQQKDGGKVIQIKIRAKSHIPMTAEWFKASYQEFFDQTILHPFTPRRTTSRSKARIG